MSASAGNGADCGESMPDLFGSAGRGGLSSRTSRLCYDAVTTWCEVISELLDTALPDPSSCPPVRLVPPRSASASGLWQTPTTRDYKGQSGLGNRTRRGRNGRLHVANLCDQLVDIGRPDLVRSVTFRERLMGFPIGHTDSGRSETPSSRRARSPFSGRSKRTRTGER